LSLLSIFIKNNDLSFQKNFLLSASCFLFSLVVSSQIKVFTGTVTDSLNIPLENANVLANPSDGGSFKFAIADHKGRYRIELDKDFDYDISVSYIGYTPEKIFVEKNSELSEHHFKLKNIGVPMKEIIITHKYEPIVIKKDTMIYDVGAYSSGNERKMKEVLDKLPGVEVDKDGKVTVQGKQITQMMVEGKPFFGGGTKLAVENIPADALDKIEVIDNFNQVGFLKEVSDSKDLAMNVVLKEDKKKFLFGDLEAGTGNKEFNILHTALFRYTPTLNLSFIGDHNNIGKSVFTFEDLMRFQGGISSFLNSNRKNFSNLYTYYRDNRDIAQNKSNFAALNYGFKLSEKIDILGFGLFSKLFTQNNSKTEIEYLTNQNTTFENRVLNNTNRDLLAMFNIKLDYSKSKNEKYYYNSQIDISNNKANSLLESNTNLNNSTFETLNKADNISFKQYIEWHKSHNKKHTTTFVVNQIYQNTKPENQWFTDQEFLTSFIPIQVDNIYNISQLKKQKHNGIDAIFKHYWVLNRFNHLYTNIGNNFTKTDLETSEKQLLSDGTINDFSVADFGNNVNYTLNDAYFGLEYKFKIKKITSKASLYLHLYTMKSKQISQNYSLSKTLLEPAWNSQYELNKYEKLIFDYAFKNEFPRAEQIANNYTLSGYNSVFKGNVLLKNEQFHTSSFRYSNMNIYRGLNTFANLSFNKKIKTIRNQVVFQETNRFTMPFITDNPETNWNFSGSVQKKIYFFRFEIRTRLSWFDYKQTVNAILSDNTRTSQSIGANVRTTHKEYPSFYFGYTKTFNQFKGLSATKFETDSYNVTLDYEFLPSWIFKADYSYFLNSNISLNQKTDYQIANLSLDYQKKNSAWGFNFSVNNILNNKTKINNSISDFLISEQTTYILPSIFLFSVRYKL